MSRKEVRIFMNFDSEQDWNLYKQLRPYGAYADFNGSPSLEDEKGQIYHKKDIIEILECQASSGCKCEIYTVKTSHLYTIRLISKEGHTGHEDKVIAEKLYTLLKQDKNLKYTSLSTYDHLYTEILKHYPYQKGKSVFQGLLSKEVSAVVQKLIKEWKDTAIKQQVKKDKVDSVYKPNSQSDPQDESPSAVNSLEKIKSSFDVIKQQQLLENKLKFVSQGFSRLKSLKPKRWESTWQFQYSEQIKLMQSQVEMTEKIYLKILHEEKQRQMDKIKIWDLELNQMSEI